MSGDPLRSGAALDSLGRVYRHRVELLHRAVREAAADVLESEQELLNRNRKVAALEGQADRARAYMQTPEAGHDARAIELSLNYLAAVEYDVERERWYVELTEQELAEKQTELDRRRRAVATLETRIDAVERLGDEARRTHRRRLERRTEDALADDMRSGKLT